MVFDILMALFIGGLLAVGGLLLVMVCLDQGMWRR